VMGGEGVEKGSTGMLVGGAGRLSGGGAAAGRGRARRFLRLARGAYVRRCRRMGGRKE
jgi:hypothetical protein